MRLCNILKFLIYLYNSSNPRHMGKSFKSLIPVFRGYFKHEDRCTHTHRLPRMERPPEMRVAAARKVCVCVLCSNFIPFMCCWPWVHVCQSLIWSSSADAHVASTQVIPEQEVTQEHVKDVVVQQFENMEQVVESCDQTGEWKCSKIIVDRTL